MEKNINYSKSFKIIDEFFKKYNEGKTQQDKTALKAGHYATMQAIIKLYGNYLYKKKMLFVKGSVGASYEEIPPLNTNNIRIAEHIKGSDRTVRNHIRRLIEAGLIVRKQNHGRVQNFDLWINPEVLGVKKELKLSEINKEISKRIIEADTEEIEAKKASSESSLRKKLPLNVSCDTETKNKDNNTNQAQDKESLTSDNNSVSPKVETKDTRQETRESKTKSTTPPKKKEKNVAAKKEKSPSNEPNEKMQELDKFVKTLVDNLYKFAKMFIYDKADIELEEHQEVIGKRHLRKYFDGVKNKETAKKWFDQYGKRLLMASRYYKNNPKYEPYLPSYYFDPENKNGFTATRKWYLQHLENKLKETKNRHLSYAVKQIKAAPNDAGVYTSEQQKLSRFRDKKLLNRFDFKVKEIRKNLENE